MEFKMPFVKKREFEATYLSMRSKNNITDAGVVLTFNNDYEYAIAQIEDSIINKLSSEEVSLLNSIALSMN